MKIAEIKEMTTNDLVERVEAKQLIITRWLSIILFSFGKSCSNQTITQDYCAYENRITPKRT